MKLLSLFLFGFESSGKEIHRIRTSTITLPLVGVHFRKNIILCSLKGGLLQVWTREKLEVLLQPEENTEA